METKRLVEIGIAAATALGLVGGNVMQATLPADCSEPIERWETQLNRCEAQSIRDSDECWDRIERASRP